MSAILPDVSTVQRIAELRREIGRLQELNAIYRSQGHHSYPDKAAQQKRKVRLEEIKQELATLRAKSLQFLACAY
jgi:hypothetical protein